jgi:hypothetical protein
MCEYFCDEMRDGHSVFLRKLVQVLQHGSHIQVPVHDYGARRFVPTGNLNSSSRAVEFTVRNQESATVVHKEH